MEYVYRNRLLEDWRNSKNMGYHLMTVPAESKCSHGMTKKERKRLCVKHVSSCRFSTVSQGVEGKLRIGRSNLVHRLVHGDQARDN